MRRSEARAGRWTTATGMARQQCATGASGELTIVAGDRSSGPVRYAPDGDAAGASPAPGTAPRRGTRTRSGRAPAGGPGARGPPRRRERARPGPTTSRSRPLHVREPVAPLLVDLEVRARVDVGAQRLDRLPDRQVDDDLVVVVDRHRGRVVAAVAGQAPDEARRAIGERVDLVEPRHEAGQLRRIERRDEAGDVDLGQMEGSHDRVDSIGGT